MKDETNIVVRKFRNRDEANDARRRVLEAFLLATSTAFQQTDLAAKVNNGVLEFESFVDALLGGGSHPALDAWLARRKGTTAANIGTLRARRLIMLMAIALERSGMNGVEARRMAAQETTRAGIFPGETISAKALEHWLERMPDLAPADEQLIANAIANGGTAEKHRIALYFVGLAHFAHNPSVVVVPMLAE
jgi:hypothetical protein